MSKLLVERDSKEIYLILGLECNFPFVYLPYTNNHNIFGCRRNFRGRWVDKNLSNEVLPSFAMCCCWVLVFVDAWCSVGGSCVPLTSVWVKQRMENILNRSCTITILPFSPNTVWIFFAPPGSKYLIRTHCLLVLQQITAGRFFFSFGGGSSEKGSPLPWMEY